jgi:hypothetical protein
MTPPENGCQPCDAKQIQDVPIRVLKPSPNPDESWSQLGSALWRELTSCGSNISEGDPVHISVPYSPVRFGTDVEDLMTPFSSMLLEKLARWRKMAPRLFEHALHRWRAIGGLINRCFR